MILVRISFNVNFAQLHYICNVCNAEIFYAKFCLQCKKLFKVFLNVIVLCQMRKHCLLHIIFRFVTVIKFSTLFCDRIRIV